jgi:hypothetical protein
MKLTDTQRVLLSTASQREDRGIELAANLKGGAAQKLVRNLLAEGLIEEVGAAGSLAVWRRGKGNRPRALCITERGLAAIRVGNSGVQRPIPRPTSFRSLLLIERRPPMQPLDSRPSSAGEAQSRPA